MVMPPVKARTVRSRPTAAGSARLTDAGSRLTRAGVAQRANRSPAAPAMAASTEGFGQRLRRQPRASRAEGHADGHFLPPPDGPRDDQVRDVHARDQQDETDGRQQEQQRAARVAHHGVAERDREVLRTLILGRILLFHLTRDRVQLRDCARRRHALAQANGREHPSILALGRRLARNRHRDDRLGVRVGREPEAARHDADNLPVDRAHPDRPADHGGIAAETLFPEIGAEHDDRRGALSGVGGRQGSSERRYGPEHVQQAGGRVQRPDVERFVCGKDGLPRFAVGGQRLEGLLTRAQIDEVAHGDVGLRDAGPAVAVLQEHQPIGVRIRQRTEQRRVHDREDGDVGPDTERQGQDGRHREAGFAHEEPQRVTCVVQKHGEHLRGRQAPALEKDEDRAGNGSPSGAGRFGVQVVQRRVEQILPDGPRHQGSEEPRQSCPTHRTSAHRRGRSARCRNRGPRSTTLRPPAGSGSGAR